MRIAWPDEHGQARIVWVVFGISAVASFVVILIGSRDTLFSGDELGMLYRVAHQPLGEALFEPPPDKYLIAVPTLLYGAIATVFGADAYLPYRVLGALLVILAAGLFLVLASRRGPIWFALGGAVLLLFLGTGSTTVAIPGQVPGQIAICAGLGMLLALERDDRRRAIAACSLGVLAVISHPIALTFLVAGGVLLVARTRTGWRNLWVVVVPALVYGLWWTTLRQPPSVEAPVPLSGVLEFGRDAFVVLCGAVTGIFRPPWTDGVDLITPATAVLAVLALIGAVVAVIRARRVTPWLMAAAAALAFNLIAPALAPGGFAFGLRGPETPRYIYPGVILLFWVIAELLALRAATTRRSTALAAGACVVFALAMISNIGELIDSARGFRAQSAVIESELGALEAARKGRTPEQMAAQRGIGVDESAGWLALMPLFSNADGVESVVDAAPAAYAIADSFGLMALSPEQLADLEGPLAEQADLVLEAARPDRR